MQHTVKQQGGKLDFVAEVNPSYVMHVGYFQEIQIEIVQKYLWKILEHGVDGWRLAW